MSIRRSKTVQIINPLPGGSSFTSYKRALQFVRRGLATFEAQEAAIRFTDQSLCRQDGSPGRAFHGVWGLLVEWRRSSDQRIIHRGEAQKLKSCAPDRPQGRQDRPRNTMLSARARRAPVVSIPFARFILFERT